MTTNNKGVLSQAIANMINVGNTIAHVTGLPQSAVNIQKDVENVISNLVPKFEDVQASVLNLTNTLEDLIESEISQLQDINGGVLKRFLAEVMEITQPVDTLIQSTFKEAISANEKIAKDDQKLQVIAVDLKAKISGLHSQLSGEKQKLDALEKKKLYLLGLGFLGAPGLIALGILLSETQGDVSNIEKNISGIQNQVSTQNAFLSHTNAFTTDLSTLINKISGISNSMNFLTGDLGNITKDIDHEKITSKITVELYLNAALQEVKTLRMDVS